MDVTKQYAIAWKGLKNGTYRFDFKVDNALFEAYGSTDIKDGDLSVGVTLDGASRCSRCKPSSAVR